MPARLEYTVDYTLKGELFLDVDDPIDIEHPEELVVLEETAVQLLRNSGFLLANESVELEDPLDRDGSEYRICYEIQGCREDELLLGAGDSHILDRPEEIVSERVEDDIYDREKSSDNYLSAVHIFCRRTELVGAPQFNCFSYRFSLVCSQKALGPRHAAEMYAQELKEVRNSYSTNSFTVIVERDSKEYRFNVKFASSVFIEETTGV